MDEGKAASQSPFGDKKNVGGIDITGAVVVGTTEVSRASLFGGGTHQTNVGRGYTGGTLSEAGCQPDNGPKLHPRIKSETSFAETALTAAGRRNPR